MKPVLLIAIALTLVAFAVPYGFHVEDAFGNDVGHVGMSTPIAGSGVWTYRNSAGDLMAVGKYTDMGGGWIIFTTEDGGNEYIWHANKIGSTKRWAVMGQDPFMSPTTGPFYLEESF